ncbi:MAG: biotin transporter BioY [Chlamydiia bacterium]|nr:biotin transporter BioY [Chlamydiia bacterium]
MFIFKREFYMVSSHFSCPAYAPARLSTWMQDLSKIVFASILISLSAYIRIPLFFTPVPLVLQSHVVLLMAALLGVKRGSMATLLFVMAGMLGLPVFAGAKPGLSCLVGPTGGYLVGYISAAFVTGYILNLVKKPTLTRIFSAMACGNLLIYVCGVCGLSVFMDWTSCLTLGIVPFLIGDALKLLCTTKAIHFFSSLAK